MASLAYRLLVSIYPYASPTFSSLSPPMASKFSFQPPKLSSKHMDSAGTKDTIRFKSPSYQEKYWFTFTQFLSSHKISLTWSSSRSSSLIPSSARDQIILEDEPSLGIITHENELEFNRVNRLVWVLHESARSFSLAIQTLEFSRNGPNLSKAWIGVDVNAWHKRTAYQVAVYALLKAAFEVELLLSHKRCNNSPVCKILSAKTLFLGEFVESQLNAKNTKLVQWFRTVELPRIAGLFIPLFKKWSLGYARSGVAGVIIAISCCTAVRKLGSGRIACPLFTLSVDNILVELLDLSCDLVSADKLHHLAIEAGFEEEFLSHFGKKVLPSENIEDVEFWIGLVQEKLSLAFHRESVITAKQTFNLEETTLATLGIFAFLGRETRLYLSEMNIKDIDDNIKDFLSYLECGSVYIYPEFNSLSKYQLFIEVVIDEIGWLDFYAPLKCKFQYDGRSRQQAIQAEKEIIVYSVLTVCYDVFSGFAHYTNSSKQSLDSDLLSFLFRSQSLLSNSLEEYWAAYDKSGKTITFAERFASDSSLICQDGSRVIKGGSVTGVDHVKLDESKPLYERLVRASVIKMISARNIIMMGTQLLFIDVADVFGLLMKQLCGTKITSRERRKIKRTLIDMVTLVPVTILMLIPVSAVGHAAILAAINKYIPSLIPSPYSTERLNLVRQLKRTKKMEVETWAIDMVQDHIRETCKESEEDKSFTVTVP